MNPALAAETMTHASGVLLGVSIAAPSGVQFVRVVDVKSEYPARASILLP